MSLPQVTSSPSAALAAVTPSDSSNIAQIAGQYPRALYIGTAGNVAILTPGAASAVTLVGATAGSIIPVQTQRVNSTNTTASNIVALY
jgi:hypothetical protein